MLTQLLIALVAVAFAAPARPGPHAVPLPDGSSLTLFARGDEFTGSRFVDAEGHTVVVSEEGVSFVIDARTGALSQPVQSLEDAVRISSRATTQVPTEWAERGASKRAAHEVAEREISQTPGYRRRTLGSSVPIVVILVQYANYSMSTGTLAHARNKFFGTANNTVAGYYHSNSGGNFEFVAASESQGTVDDGIIGPVTVSCTQLNAVQWGVSVDYTCVYTGAFTQADQFIDYSSFDTNHDSKISDTELQIVIIVAGGEGAYLGQSATCPTVWGHKAVGYPVTKDGVTMKNHLLFGEMWKDCTNQFGAGVAAHELGHGIGLPDLYDVYTGAYSIVGSWCLMDNGCWSNTGENPSMISPFMRMTLGWLQPIVATTSTSQTLTAVSDYPSQVLIFGDNPNGVDWIWSTQSGVGEYFLVENRQKVGVDQYIPAAGVLVWHINEAAEPNSNMIPYARIVSRIKPLSGGFIANNDESDLLATAARSGVFGCSSSSNPNSLFDNGMKSCISLTASVTNQIATIQEFTPSCGTCVANSTFPAVSGYRYLIHDISSTGLVALTNATTISSSTTDTALDFNFTFYGQSYDRIWIDPTYAFLSFEQRNYLQYQCASAEYGLFPKIAPLVKQEEVLKVSYQSTTCASPFPVGRCAVVDWTISSGHHTQVLLAQNGQLFLLYSTPSTISATALAEYFMMVSPGHGKEVSTTPFSCTTGFMLNGNTTLRLSAVSESSYNSLPFVDNMEAFPGVSGSWFQLLGGSLGQQCGSSSGQAMVFSSDNPSQFAMPLKFLVSQCNGYHNPTIAVAFFFGYPSALFPLCTGKTSQVVQFAYGFDQNISAFAAFSPLNSGMTLVSLSKKNSYYFSIDIPSDSHDLLIAWIATTPGMWSLDTVSVQCAEGSSSSSPQDTVEEDSSGNNNGGGNEGNDSGDSSSLFVKPLVMIIFVAVALLK